MKIRLKARRLAGNDPVSFKNTKGASIQLDEIGSVSQDLDPSVAHALCKQFPDMLEVADSAAPEAKMAKAPENKMVSQPKAAKHPQHKSSEEQALTPPSAE